MRKKRMCIQYAIFLGLIITPLFSYAANEKLFFAATVGDLLNPDKWFESFKKNITFPIPTSTDITNIELPTPENVLNQSSSTLQDINRGVRDETGIDFAKFIGWSARVLKAFLQVIIKLLETISKTMSG